MTTRKAYMCGIAWQEDMNHRGDVKFFRSVEDLKEAHDCWEECGIVELDVSLSKWVVEQDLFGKRKPNER